MALMFQLHAFRLLEICVFLIAPMGVAATMGLVPLLVAMCLGCLVFSGGLGGLIGAFPRRYVLIFSAFTIFGGLSAFWALDPFRAVTLSLRLAALCIAGLIVMRTMMNISSGHRYRLGTALVAGVAAGLAIMLIAFVYAKVTGDSLWGEHSGNPLTPLSRGEAVLGLLFWPAALILWRRLGWKGVLALLATILLTFAGMSNSAVLLSLAAGGGVFLAVLLFKRRIMIPIAAAYCVMAALAPVIIDALPDGDAMYQKAGYTYPTLVHRFYIWNFVTEKIAEKPVLGWGLDASRKIPGRRKKLDQSYFKADLSNVSRLFNAVIMPLHPHNTALQVWLELGVPGALFMVWAIILVFSGTFGGGARPSMDALRASTATAYLVIGALSYGAWQNWWVAMGWIEAALVCLCLEIYSCSDAKQTYPQSPTIN